MSPLSHLSALTRELLHYREPAVRDLAWVIASPPLLAGGLGGEVSAAWCAGRYAAMQEWLMALDRDPAVLQAWLAHRASRRLGLYFEALLGFWLAHGPGMSLARERAQVWRDGRTLGEFDFLFRDAQRPGRLHSLPSHGSLIHWEAAIKLYLHVPPQVVAAGTEPQWWGPNARDCLEYKLARLHTHQLRLGEAVEAGDLLASLRSAGGQGDTSVMAEAFVKGYLFYPLAADKAGLVEPSSVKLDPAGTGPAVAPLAVEAGELRQALEPAHLRGWWLRAGEGQLPAQGEETRWRVLKRLEWLAPRVVEVQQAAELLPRVRMQQRLQAMNVAEAARAVLLAEFMALEDGRWVEVARGFVVPRTWPRPTDPARHKLA